MTQLRALLVGAGGMGKAWGRAIAGHPDVTLAGWVDVVGERAASAALELGVDGVAVGDDPAASLRSVEPDFVIDAAVPEAHSEITLACLERKIPVLGEKPLAATMEEARALVAASERTGTLFAVSQNRRYDKGLAAFREVVAGSLGGTGQINAEFYRGPHFGGFRDEMDSPLLLDMAIHTFDAARYVIGADPVSVFCSEYNPSWSWYKGAASAVAEFEFANGAHFSYQGSWCAQGLSTSWQSSWRALGPYGSAIWDGQDRIVAELAGTEGEPSTGSVRTEVTPPPIPAEDILGSLADFVRALRGGEQPMTECHDNIRSLAMVLAARESHLTGQRVPVKW
jgi:predicted dehydrogenase